MLKIILIILFSMGLVACAATTRQPSELQQGKRYFEKGYYKRTLRQLLPLACDGNAEAQYAIGYLYYYGYGVTQDTETGVFWINRAAKQHYIPAIKALDIMAKDSNKRFKVYK
jgi:TPR repeat protein